MAAEDSFLEKRSGYIEYDYLLPTNAFKNVKAITSDERVEIRGFGSFTLREYKAYRGRNPKSGETVNVEPKNEKLADRARRIVAQAAGVTYEQAGELLDAAGNSVRVAILMGKTGAGRVEAERRLAEAGGSISRVLNG